MLDWGRLEFLPGLNETRVRRHLERERRVEWASRDAIFFAAMASSANESLMWAACMLIGTSGALLSSYVLHAEPLGVRLLLLALGTICALATPGYLWRAVRVRAEWKEALARRAARSPRMPAVI
jgi:hypothetical protein